MKYLIENLKNSIINFVIFASLVTSSITAFNFFLIALLSEAIQGKEKSKALFEELSFIQSKIERIPVLIQEFLGWKKPDQQLMTDSY